MPDSLPYDGPDSLEDVWDATIASAPDSRPAFIARHEGVLPLGHDRGIFYYFSVAAGQVYDLKPGEHGRAMLCAMASITHWEASQWFKEKKGVDWDAASAFLMQACRDVGIYNPDRIRGRGAWIDDGRSILHLGDRLLVDGAVHHNLTLEGSAFVYEAARPLAQAVARPLTNADAYKLVALLRRLSWDRPVNAILCAGFIATASVCGGLKWRSAVWITGSAGTGKSTVFTKIIAAALGGMALEVQSKTSEAGIRQELGSDARPVLFDEAEGEDHHAAARMQGVLDLVRQSSSEGGAEIIKGTQNQKKANRFRIRSNSCWPASTPGFSTRRMNPVSPCWACTRARLARKNGSSSSATSPNSLRPTSLPAFCPAACRCCPRSVPTPRRSLERLPYTSAAKGQGISSARCWRVPTACTAACW